MRLDRYAVEAKALAFARDRLGGTERERAVLFDLATEANHFHLVFNCCGVFYTAIPWQDDDNGGLPEWFFEGDHNTALEVDLSKNQVEWIPAVGPAPVWRAKFSEFGTTDQLWGTFANWYRQNY